MQRDTQPKKSLGQNFLRDPKILKKIVDFAQIEKEDTVVEIGPGEGTLTKFLLEQAHRVIAIEKDFELATQLKEKFHKEILDNRLQIIEGDALDTKIYNLLSTNYKLIGNIPYNITGALFKKFLENPPSGVQPKSITFVVQKEVAERVIARDAKESILSISIKVYGKPEMGGVIKAGSFFPKPKVDSAILAIRDINKKRFEGESEKKFFEILKAGFAHKRKLLIKNLSKGIFEMPQYQKMPFDIIFKKCGVPEKARAEDLKVENWLCISKEISNQK